MTSIPANGEAVPLTAVTSNASASSATYNVIAVGDREPAVDGTTLFTLQVLGLRHIRLVPKNALGRALLNSWIGANVKLVGRYLGASGPGASPDDRMTELGIEFEHLPMLTERGDPFRTGLRLAPWQYTLAREALDRDTAKRDKMRDRAARIASKLRDRADRAQRKGAKEAKR
jgi:hypothetical protein